jgi:hypothetical protein
LKTKSNGMKITAARFTVHANAVESTMFRITNALKEKGRGLKMVTRAAEPQSPQKAIRLL